MDLHYSQTIFVYTGYLFLFHYLMDLHYSQTSKLPVGGLVCFTTLWIYTILKHFEAKKTGMSCFTTLWIYTILKPNVPGSYFVRQFHYLMDLHYSQTSKIILLHYF